MRRQSTRARQPCFDNRKLSGSGCGCDSDRQYRRIVVCYMCDYRNEEDVMGKDVNMNVRSDLKLKGTTSVIQHPGSGSLPRAKR